MTTVIVPIRSDNAYFGLAKEITPGTPQAPIWFPRWFDGSSIEVNAKMEDVKEGDGTRRDSQIIKNGQEVKIKLVCSPRMNELGFLEEAAMGAGSDSYTPPTVSTTLSAGTAIGATSISVAANTGLAGTGTIGLILDAGTAAEEIALFNLPATGVGPYTLTVASTYNNGNGLKVAHLSGHTVKSSAIHTLTDQYDGDYFTVEVGLGSLYSAAGTTIRVRSCKVNTCKRSGKAGGPLMFDIEFEGIACAVQGSPSTITLEQHSLFLYTQGTWVLDGSSTSTDALSIESWDIEQKNNVDSVQTEQLTRAALTYGAVNIGLGFDVVYTSPGRFFLVYFGNPSGTADAQAIGAGSWVVTFTQPDTFQQVSYTMLTTHYTKAGLPVPKKDGKHSKITLSATSVSNSGQNAYVLQTIVNNSQYSSY